MFREAVESSAVGPRLVVPRAGPRTLWQSWTWSVRGVRDILSEDLGRIAGITRVES